MSNYSPESQETALRFRWAAALCGIGVGLGLGAFFKYTGYSAHGAGTLLVAILLCPTSVIVIQFYDKDPGSIGFAVGWAAIAFANGLTYAIVAQMLEGFWLRLARRKRRL